MLNGHILHQQNYTGQGEIIGVIDSGFPGVDTADIFRRIRKNKQILGTYDLAYRDDNVYTGRNHGTKVLATMAAYEEGKLIGTSPDASFYLFRVSHPQMVISSAESYFVEAMEMADSLGVNVINLSQGISQSRSRPNDGYTYEDMNGKTTFLSRGADMAFSRGRSVVTSAGNKGNQSWQYITAPADSINVLAVGSVTYEKIRDPFSSQGPTADGRIKPDIMALGYAVIAGDENGSINYERGTSFAAPIITGLVSCLWQALPNKTNAEIIQLVKGSADHFTNPDNFYGYGIPDFKNILDKVLATTTFTRNGVTLYPNPTNDFVKITTPEISGGKLIVHNYLGQEVIRQQLTGSAETTVSMEKLKTGIYLYTIMSGIATFSGKIIKK
jgi:subtilisin family serine protease